MVEIKTQLEESNFGKGLIKVVRGNILELEVDAILDPTNFFLSGTGLISAVHSAGGPQLEAHFRDLAPLEIGETKITPGYNLPAKWIVHTASPIWIDDLSGAKNEEILARCYRSCLRICNDYSFAIIAIPGIATGVNNFPIERTSQIAIDLCDLFLQTNKFPKQIIFVCSQKEEYQIYQNNLLSMIWHAPVSPLDPDLDDLKQIELQKIERTLTDRNRSDELKISCIKTALRHGKYGIKIIFKILKTERGELQYSAYDLLWKKANNKGKKRLLNYFPWSSEVGADLSKLHDLLIAKKWKKADLETRRLMLAIAKADRPFDRVLTQKDIATFPATDLLNIDRLWIRYSSGKFGFTVVKQIFDRVDRDYPKLASKVGWVRADKWLQYEDLTFSDKAFRGHLPVAWLVPISCSEYWNARFASVGWNLLFDRLNSIPRTTVPSDQ